MMFNKYRTIFIAIIILIVAGAIAGFLSKQKKPGKRSNTVSSMIRTVETITVNNQSVTLKIPVTGKVRAVDKMDLYAEVTGVMSVGQTPFKEGVHVRKGEILLKINDEEAQLNLRAQKSNFLTLITQILPDIKLDFSTNYGNWEEYLAAFKIDQPISPLPEPATESEKYFLATRNLFSQYYAIKSAEVRLSKYTLIAPYDGVITANYVNPGTVVRAGQKLGEFISQNHYELECAISVQDINDVQIGSHVQLSSDDASSVWTGQIQRISEVIDARTQSVKIFILIKENHLKDGMFLSGYIDGKIIDNAIEIPRKLILPDNTLYAVEDGILTKKSITLVKVQEESSVVKGLENGTLLLKENFAGAYAGLKVKTVGEKSEKRQKQAESGERK